MSNDKLNPQLPGDDSWLDEIAEERWGDAVVTKAVSVEAMHQWLADHPDAFIAAFQA